MQSRIKNNPQVFASLSEEQRDFVKEGRIALGMPKGGVFLAWGRPDNVFGGDRDGMEFESWRFRGNAPGYRDRSFSLRYDHYGFGNGPYSYYRPYTAANVNFHADRVTGWETVK